jgi:transcriptional regulator with XRE-family HTH domain
MENESAERSEMDLQIQERLAALLKKKGLSRRQLADRINIQEGYLGKMMRGERPWKVSYLKQVADGLDVPLEALLGETCELPVVAEIGSSKEREDLSFDYKAVVLPLNNRRQVPCPELPKSLAVRSYVVEVTGKGLMPELPPGSRLYIARGQGNGQNLNDGDLAIYVVDETQRGYVCRIERRDPEIHFHPLYADPQASGTFFKRFTETTLGIDVVIAIVLLPDLLVSG